MALVTLNSPKVFKFSTTHVPCRIFRDVFCEIILTSLATFKKPCEPSVLVILHFAEVLNDKAGDQVDTRHANHTLSIGPI